MTEAKEQNLSKKTYSVKSYVQDGLVAVWDGIENAGFLAHDPAAAAVKNLYGSYSLKNIVMKDNGRFNFSQDNEQNITDVNQVFSSGTFIIEIAYDRVVASNGTVWMGRSYNGTATWQSSIQFTDNYVILYNTVNNHKAFGIGFGSLAVTSSAKACEGHSYALGGDKKKFSSWDGNHDYGTRTLFYTSNDICCIRVYNRTLSDDEIAGNWEVDEARFRI